MTTLWVMTRAGYLTEGLQVSENPASSEDGSRAHLFRERLALREHPLPDGPAPPSWVSVPKSPDFQPRLASPDVGFYSLFTKLRCEGGTTRRASRGDVLSPSLVRRPGRRRLAAEPQRRAPTRPKAMVARPCRNGLRNHGDPSSVPPWSLACARRAEPGALPGIAAAPVYFLPLEKPQLRVPRWRQATARSRQAPHPFWTISSG
jgi:hypothetical protein